MSCHAFPYPGCQDGNAEGLSVTFSSQIQKSLFDEPGSLVAMFCTNFRISSTCDDAMQKYKI